MKVAIVTDSSADVSTQEALGMGIYVLRMPMVVGDEEYVEEETISRDALIAAMIEGKAVSTSQPNVYAAKEVFNKLLETYDQIIFLPISSRLSGAYASFKALEGEMAGRLRVIDTLSVAYPLFYAVKHAKAWVDKGVSVDVICKELEDNSHFFAALVPSDVQYLKRGGRIKPGAAAVANLLKIFPVLQVTEGEIDVLDKVRTHRRAILVAIEAVIERCPVGDYDYFVIDGGSPRDKIEEIRKEVESRVGSSVLVRDLYPVILAHTGPGTVAIGAIKKYKELS